VTGGATVPLVHRRALEATTRPRRGWSDRERLSLRFEEHFENLSDRDFIETLPAERQGRIQFVEVTASYPTASQVPALYQIRHEPVCRPLLDSHEFGDLTDPDSGVACDAVERMQMISHETPFSHATILPAIHDMH
jgi:hypothetical protein